MQHNYHFNDRYSGCSSEIKSESIDSSSTTPISIESPLFPLTSLHYDSYNLGFNLNSLKESSLRDLERKIKPPRNETSNQRKQREENRERMQRFRLSLTEVEKQIRRQQNAQHMREFRRNLPEMEKQIRRQKAAEYMREFRRNLSEVERQVRRKIDTERMRKFRSNLTEIEKEIRRQKAKERMRRQREDIRMRNLATINGDNYNIDI